MMVVVVARDDWGCLWASAVLSIVFVFYVSFCCATLRVLCELVLREVRRSCVFLEQPKELNGYMFDVSLAWWQLQVATARHC